jgi:hypothetical protein
MNKPRVGKKGGAKAIAGQINEIRSEVKTVATNVAKKLKDELLRALKKPKKGGAKKWSTRLDELGKQPPPAELVNLLNAGGTCVTQLEEVVPLAEHQQLQAYYDDLYAQVQGDRLFELQQQVDALQYKLTLANELVGALEAEPLTVEGKTADGRPLHKWTKYLKVRQAIEAYKLFIA